MRTFERNQLFAILRAVYLTGAATSMVWIIANYATASAVTIPLMLLGGVFLVLTIAAAINAARKDRFLRGSSIGVLSVGTQRFLRLVGLTIGIPPILYCAVFAFLVLTFDGKQNALDAVTAMINFETQAFGKTVILDYVNALIRIRPIEPLPEPAQPVVSTEIQPLESSPCAIYNPANTSSNPANSNPQPAGWSPLQAVGPPNTLTPQADSPTAWASATRDGQDEWITLTYATPVIPSSIQIFEALSPGAVSRVCAYDENDNEIELWSGVDPLLNRQKTANADNSWNWSWVLPIPPAQRFETKKVTLYLSSMNVADWNEIDAVGLNTGDGIHWAVDAFASSTYADKYFPIEPQSYSNRGSQNPWYPVQATGAPDTTGYGDITTAWASATQDDQSEWLEVEFGDSIASSQLDVYETYNPGAIYQVDLYGKNDRIVATWSGHDPTSPYVNSGVSKIPVSTYEPITKARLYLDSTRVPGWNEIDAVGLRDTKGKIHWATAAKASTTYGVVQ